ncbi:MAG TPA: YhbY family RNA-binding protein [Methylomirabilota bacterium]|nr:YhbY family RNA-binding protein [Methylomirabilota bacterium]
MDAPLSSKQVRKLKALAQRLDATLRIGRQGLSDAFLQSLIRAFDHQELVKVRFDEFKEQRKTLAPALAARSGSHLVTLIGHVAVLYRPHPDPARRRVLV